MADTTAGTPDVLRYAAFTADPAGGNPAGVVLDATGWDDARMLATAAGLGYSETAFAVPAEEERTYRVRYFSPLAEVPFCGHATVAAAVALARRDGAGEYLFHTPAGEVPVEVVERDGAPYATLTSVAPHSEPVADADLDEALAALDWSRADLAEAPVPRIAFAGARHLVLAAATRERLADLAYDFERLKAYMLRLDLTTVHLLWRDADDADGDPVFHARDPFPVGGVVEDPATGAAAAAFGGWARESGLVPEESRLTLHQGADMGRPGVLTVTLHAGDPRVRVSGTAVPLAE
ncbi:PhzF family phenazine biosynthesis protein [Streptomyces sp. NPDC048182]|uniref:PhzF family phenazine biosynthesis protein n=1 Tax=Streptomyces sp. NPDC048182 TaxID=3365507 RepID=UPI00371BB92D